MGVVLGGDLPPPHKIKKTRLVKNNNDKMNSNESLFERKQTAHITRGKLTSKLNVSPRGVWTEQS